MTDQIDDRRNCTSASNAESDQYCPGRHLAQRGLPHRDTKDSETGTKIHEALYRRSPAGLSVEEVSTYEQCAMIEARKATEFFGAENVAKLKTWAEQRYWVQFLEDAKPPSTPKKLEHSAKPDRVYRLENRLLILEYKTLFSEATESPRNLQLRDQAVVCAGHFMVDEVGVCVIQPWVEKNPTIALYTKELIARARAEMLGRVIASNDPRSARVPGDRQCKYCLAALNGVCLEYNRWAGSCVPNVAGLLDVPVSAWTPEQRRVFCDRYDTARKWLDDCWSKCEEGAQATPGFVEGYVMVDGAVKQEISDPTAVFNRFLGLGGAAEKFLETVTVGKTKLKEQLRAVTGLTGRKLEEKFKEMVTGCIREKQNKASLRKVEP